MLLWSLGLARFVLEQIETFGRVTLEAMSCGLACVVNRECGDHLVKVRENKFFLQFFDIFVHFYYNMLFDNTEIYLAVIFQTF